MASEAAEGEGEDARVCLLSQTVLELPRSIASLENASRALPTEEDFHFLHNFVEFAEPVQALLARAENVMSRIASLTLLNNRTPRWPADSEGLSDWLVAVQDEILEQVDTAFDRFKMDRANKGLPADDDGFMVQNRKRRRRDKKVSKDASTVKDVQLRGDGAKTHLCVEKDARFHKWEVRRPQEKFVDIIDNSNSPFVHPNNGHPLQENLVNIDFERFLQVSICDPKPPESLSNTPFTFVNTASSLVELASKLSQEGEIAVDLEHHNFRSFQGITCLMQISTRKEDFIVDILELRHLIGPQLSSIFANDAIQKVMHGADKDITWLQRDFGIYVCNLFDTGQAARVLKLEKYSLSYLLEHLCGVIPDKRYQMADWRDRPLSEKMMKYAREDTHYLLYVGDKMKHLLASEICDDYEKPLLEAYKRSRDVCLKLYEKEITTETSFLQVYGLAKKKFRAEQLAVLAGLYEWRDKVARIEDESTGYVLPNSLLLELAEEMPDNVKKLRSMLHSKNPILIHNLTTIIAVINKSRLSASQFEDTAVRLQTEGIKLDNKDSGAMQDKPGVDVQESKMELFNVFSNMDQVAETVRGHTIINNEVSATVTSASSASEELKEIQREWENLNKFNVNEQMPAELIKTEVAVVVKKASTSSLFGKQKKARQAPKDNMTGIRESNTLPHIQMQAMKTVNESQKSSSLGKQDTRHACVQAGNSMCIKENGVALQIDAEQSMELTEDREGVEAMSKAEKIKTSFSLPYQKFSDQDVSDEPIIHSENKIQKQEEEMQNKDIEYPDYMGVDAKEGCQDDEQTDDGIAINVDSTMDRTERPDTLDDNPHESVLTETSLVSDSEPRLPLSLSERYRVHRVRTEVGFKHKISDLTKSAMPCENSITKNNDVAVTPFDYAAAKEKMGYLRQRDERKKQTRGTGVNKPETTMPIFNPTKKVAGFKPEGIAPGKRRQVFPQSGNRTGVFK